MLFRKNQDKERVRQLECFLRYILKTETNHSVQIYEEELLRWIKEDAKQILNNTDTIYNKKSTQKEY